MRLEECEEKIDFAAEACDLEPKTVLKVKRAIGVRRRLNESFPQNCALPTDTVLELGKKSNAEFLEEAIPKLKEKLETGVRPTKKEVIAILDHVKEELKEKQIVESEKPTITPEKILPKTELKEDEIIMVGKKFLKPIKSNAVFNVTNNNIEWAKYTWNPVTGCKQGCAYCYARDIANRFYAEKFEPTFHPERMCAPTNTKLPESTDPGSRNVFVCSMADLFGDWIEQKWIDEVLIEISLNPEWTFILLTKNPQRLVGIDFPDNTWVGTTVDTQARVKPAEEAFKKVKAPVKFVSLEPLMEQVKFTDIGIFDWIIIGGRSESTGMPAGQPDWQWVEEILMQARKKGKKVYFKPNLTVRPKEYPQ